MTFGGQKVVQSGDEDRRYRMKILLVAARRPKYWVFHCPQCRMFVAELSGNVISITDVADVNAIADYQPAPLIVKCRGQCHLWFEFEILSGS